MTEAVSPAQWNGQPAMRPEINALPDKLGRALAVTPYLFGGEHGVMTDPTGLVHMRARYYHPGLRRFVNPDPIGFAGGMNWYGYAAGSPVMMVDPSGFNPDAWFFAQEEMSSKGHVGYSPSPLDQTRLGPKAGQTRHQELYFEERWANNLNWVKQFYTDLINNKLSSSSRYTGGALFSKGEVPRINFDISTGGSFSKQLHTSKSGSYYLFNDDAFGDHPQNIMEAGASLGAHSYDLRESTLSIESQVNSSRISYAWTAQIYVGDNPGGRIDTGIPIIDYFLNNYIIQPPQGFVTRGNWIIKGNSQKIK